MKAQMLLGATDSRIGVLAPPTSGRVALRERLLPKSQSVDQRLISHDDQPILARQGTSRQESRLMAIDVQILLNVIMSLVLFGATADAKPRDQLALMKNLR